MLLTLFFLLPLSLPRFFFFFNDPATPEIYTLSLHDALPILSATLQLGQSRASPQLLQSNDVEKPRRFKNKIESRSEEHTSELQSRGHLVCRLLLEKKKINDKKEQCAPVLQDKHTATGRTHSV